MGSAFDEKDETPGLERSGTGQSGISGFRRCTDGSLDCDAVEADLNRQLSELPRLFTERPTRPAPPMTPAMRIGAPEIDRDSVTPIRPSPGIIPPPPRAPRPDSFAPPASAAPPPRRTAGDELMRATLVETRALKSGMKRLLRGTSVFATVVVVLLGMLLLETGISSARSTPVTPPVAAAPAPEKHDVVEIVLTTSPRAAMFRIDQGPWLVGPYVAQVPRDDREHDVYVAANGYLPRAVKVRFTKDTLFDIVLQREPSTTAHRKSGRGS